MQAICRFGARRAGACAPHGAGRMRAGAAGFVLIAFAFAALSSPYVASDFSVVKVVENSHTAKPLALQNQRRVGKPRRLDAAVGADPGALRRGSWRRSARTAARR